MAKVVLSKSDVEKALVIKGRLAEDYLPFFVNLSKSYPFRDDVGETIQDTIVNIKMAIGLVARVFEGRGLTAAGVQELDRLNELLPQIEEARESVLRQAVQSEMLTVAMESIETGVSPEEMSLSVRLLKRTQKKKRRPEEHRYGATGWLGGAGRFFGLTPRALVSGGVLSQILAPFLGPGLMLPAAGYVGGGVMYKTARGIARLIGRLRGVRDLPVEGPEVGVPSLRGLLGRGAVSGVALPEAEAIEPGVPPSMISPRAMRETPFRTLTRRRKEMATESLFYFFDKRAYRARWTRELMGHVRAMARGVRGGVVGEAAKVAAAGVGGAATGAAVGGGIGAAIGRGLRVAGRVGLWGVGLLSLAGLGRYPEGPAGPPSRPSRILEDFLGIHIGRVPRRPGPPGWEPSPGPMKPIEMERMTWGEFFQKARGRVRDLLGAPLPSLERRREVRMIPPEPAKLPSMEVPVERMEELKRKGYLYDIPTTIEELRRRYEETGQLELLEEVKKQTELLKSLEQKPSGAAALPRDMFIPPYDSADPLLNALNTLGGIPEDWLVRA